MNYKKLEINITEDMFDDIVAKAKEQKIDINFFISSSLRMGLEHNEGFVDEEFELDAEVQETLEKIAIESNVTVNQLVCDLLSEVVDAHLDIEGDTDEEN